MDRIYALLDDLDAIINEGKRVPLMANQCVLNRDEMLRAVQEIRDSLPDAVIQANEILEHEVQIKEDANYQYESIVAEAEEKARVISLDSQEMADQLVQDAEMHARQLYERAQREANDLVANAERKAKELVSKTSIMVEADREANHILTEARSEAQRDRLATLDHCDALLKRAEDLAIEIADTLREERMSFDRER